MSHITRRSFLRTAAAGSAAAIASLALRSRPALAADGKPLNIILVLVDDMGWAELGSYGNTFNETPNLDKLAAQGMRFTQAYAAAPVCSPTRASIMTGQYPARVGITDYLRADDPNHLSPEKHTAMAKAFKKNGYVTGMAGKWHLMGDYAARRGDPKLHGFDEVMCSETAYIGSGDYWHPYDHLPGVEAKAEEEFLTDRLANETVDFIKRHKEEPFFFYLSHYSVHTRLDGKPELVEKYKKKPGAGKDHNNPVLAAMIESIDSGIGRIMATLEQAGIAENTLFMFMSDNGGEHKVTSNAPLRGAKSQLYEGGIREPLIVRWPGIAKPGTVCDIPVCSIDFYPTFLDAAGIAKESVGQAFDGVSFAPLLKGAASLERDSLCWHYPLEKPHFLGGRSGGCIRKGDLKLIEFFDTGECELYDLEADLSETTNLAEKEPEKVKALKQALAEWRSEVGAKI